MRLGLRECHKAQRDPKLIPRQPAAFGRLGCLHPVPDLHTSCTLSKAMSYPATGGRSDAMAFLTLS